MSRRDDLRARIGQQFAILPGAVAMDERVSDSEIRTLIAIAVHADKNGWCYPSQKTLAEIRDISRRTIIRHIQKLRDLGYLEIKGRHRDDGGQASNDMRVVVQIDHEGGVTYGMSQGGRHQNVIGGVKPGCHTNNNTNEQNQGNKATERRPAAVAYENNIGQLSKDLEKKIVTWAKDVGDQWVIDAIQEAKAHDAYSWNYVRAILKRWKNEGRGPRDRQNGQGNVAAEAWAVVTTAIKKGRADPIMARQDVLDTLNNIGGWRRVKDASEREITFIKKEFMKEYHV